MPLIVTPGQFTQRAELYHQLGSMLSAGMPLTKAVEMAQQNLPNASSRRALFKIGAQIQEGHTFADSIANVSGWITSFDLALLSAGEKSGRLDVVFKSLASYYNNRAKITRDAISQMMQSVLTLHVLLLIFPLALLVNGVAKGNWTPFLIEKLFAFGLLYGITFVVLYLCQGQRGETWRGLLEELSRPIPFLGKARKFLALARLSIALESLINAGVSIITAWELSATASGSVALRRTVAKWRPHIEAGTPPSELINLSREFPQMFANLYQTGENSGQQDDTLRRLNAYYEEEGFRKLRLFTRLFNALLYLGVVIVVAYSIFSFYLGYYGAMMDAF
ncbi:MAG: type II secretion system F family protein [Verrucomicrobiota bacterium]